MTAKNNPGEFDCYAAAEPDEEMFILLARDPLASLLVSMWAAARANDGITLTFIVDEFRRTMRAMPINDMQRNKRKIVEARLCAAKMLSQRLRKELP